MECFSVTIHCGGASLHLTPKTTSSHFIPCAAHRKISLHSRKYRPLLKYNSRQNILIIRALNDEEASDINEKPTNFKWSKAGQAFGRGTHRFYQKFQRGLKKETGLDIEVVNTKIGEVAREVQAATEPLRQKSIQTAEKLRFEFLPRFLAWNRLEHWKDFKQWESKRIGAFTLYLIVVAVSFGGLFLVFRRARLEHQTTGKLAESYLEAVIPDPSRRNVRRLKQGLWRRYMPEGLKVHKYHLEGDGGYRHSKDYVGQDAWEDGTEPPQSDLENVIDEDNNFNDENNKTSEELNLGVSGGRRHASPRGTWLERLAKWDEILEKEKSEEDFDALSSKYAISFDWKEIKKNFKQQQEQRPSDSQHYRGEWISKRWWQYRPKLPYTYFLLKVECLEVEAVVFSEDFKRIYVTMKEGFPADFIVDIPADPYLSEFLTSHGVEVDTVYSRNLLPYVFRALAVLAPGTFLLWCLYSLVCALNITYRQDVKRILRSLNESMLQQPVQNEDTITSGYKDVVFGGNVWELFDEILAYMNNADKYLKQGVKFPLAILVGGPPGTGKTLLARAIARKSGLPFAFASGPQFTASDKRGSAEICKLFTLARSNAPAFIFIDEVDALAGKHANDDPVRRKAFDALIEQLDAENTSTDMHPFREAVVLLCATNRPDELNNEFYKRIEHEVYIGLPAEDQRVKMFSVHSANKRLAKDVNFEKLVFRTPGFSGADIENLVNESFIMAIRKGHNEIFQQDIIDALDKRLFENTGFLVTEEEQQMYARKVPVENKRLMAVHEAGHILLAHLFPQFDWHAITFLLPGGKEEPLSVFYPREIMVQQGYATVGYLKMQMVVAHGGHCAEEIVFGVDNVTDGGRDDLAKISTIARELVISPANPRLGLLPMTYKQKIVIPNEVSKTDLIKNKWEDPESMIAVMSVEVSELFTREVARYVDETEEEAKIALRSNRHILDRLVDELLEHSKLTGTEADEIIKSMNPVMIADPMKMPDPNVDSMGTSSFPNNRRRYQRLDISPAPLHRC